jgi:ribosomal protein RSM22 (predicted rRNA methylase)
VLAPPRAGKGVVKLKLCERDGGAGEKVLTKREGEAFRVARRLDWGDAARF